MPFLKSLVWRDLGLNPGPQTIGEHYTHLVNESVKPVKLRLKGMILCRILFMFEGMGKYMYLNSNMSFTESDINVHLGKAKTAIDWLTNE